MSKMTKKDYTLIAKVFNTYTRHLNHYGRPTIGEIARQELAKKMAKALAIDNPMFDRTKFLTACGIEVGNTCEFCGFVRPEWNTLCDGCGKTSKSH